MKLPQLRSLKSRILVMVLTMFLLSIWLLTLGIGRILRADMERALGDQQVATVTLVASQTSTSFKERADALQLIASEIDAALLDRPEAMQARLVDRPVLQVLFNAGVFVTRSDGAAIAEAPKIGRIGLNYLDRDHVAAALREGKMTVGKAVVGKAVRAPSFAISAPIRDAQGVVIGALTGATDLSKPNFLDGLISSYYGTSGGYLVVDPGNRIFVTATANNKQLVMQPLPAPGVNRVLDRRLLGFDGTAVNNNSYGVEVLTSSARIALAGWFVISTLPTQEAFAPIRSMERRLMLSAVLLTLVSLGLTWWMLRRLLAPMQSAASAVRRLVSEGAEPSPLPTTSQDEIGELIDGFNQVLAVAKRREAALSESEARFRAFFEKNLAIMLLIRPDDGRILDANDSAVDYYGHDHEALRHLHIHDLNVLSADECFKEMAEAQNEKRNFFNFRHRKADGQVRDVEVYSTPVQINDSITLFTIVHDVTERKRIELALRESEARYARVMEGTGEGFWEWDMVTQAVIISPRFETMLGYAPGEWVRSHQNWLSHVHPDDVEPSMQLFQQHLQGELPRYDNAFRMKSKQGQWLWIQSRGKVAARDAQGHPTLVAGTHTDITHQRMTEEALQTMNKDFVTLLESSSDFLYFKDRDSRFRYCSQTLANITGHKSWRDMVGKHDLEVFPPETAEVYSKEEEPVFSEGRPLLSKVDPYVKADGSPGWVSTNKWPMFADDGKTVVGLFGISRDVTDAKRLEDELLVMATTDFLTGSDSRRTFVNGVDHEIARMQRDPACLCAVMMIDLDHFKCVNDSFGHATGDEVLKHLVQLFGSEIRKGDRIGRMGGEEFAILMPGADMASAQRLAERLREALELCPIQVDGHSIAVTASIGLTSLRADDGSSGPALDRADQALYRAKHKGRNCLEVSL